VKSYTGPLFKMSDGVDMYGDSSGNLFQLDGTSYFGLYEDTDKDIAIWQSGHGRHAISGLVQQLA